VPAEQAAKLVEGDEPPTITDVAELGRKKRKKRVRPRTESWFRMRSRFSVGELMAQVVCRVCPGGAKVRPCDKTPAPYRAACSAEGKSGRATGQCALSPSGRGVRTNSLLLEGGYVVLNLFRIDLR
jgi:hypothetical protein